MTTFNATKSAVMRSTFLLGIKIGAFFLTGSAVLLAALIDSMVDVVASLIAHFVKPQEHHETHQLAIIQNAWIFMGGIVVLIESIKAFSEPVDMALTGVLILAITLAVDGTIVRNLNKETNPVVKGLAEDIKADMTNSVGGLVALTAITMGAPMYVDKVIAIVISLFLIKKGLTLAHENLVEASEDHDNQDLDNTEGIGITSANA